MPERYDDPRNRERDERHRRDHDNHSGYGSMYDRGYDYAASPEDHGRGRVHQGGPGHPDADWSREKEQQQRFGGQQQHGGYGQDEGWRARPADADRDRRWTDDRRLTREHPRDFDNWGARDYAGGPDTSRDRRDYGPARGERVEEGGFARDQSGDGRQQGYRSERDAQVQGFGLRQDRREDDRPDDRAADRGGGGMRRLGEQVRSFFETRSREPDGHESRFFRRGPDDDTGWSDRLTDARTDGGQYGERRGAWRDDHDRTRYEGRDASWRGDRDGDADRR